MGEFSAEKLFLFIIFALPGAVAIRVYSLWRPVPQKDWKESLVDAVIYSIVCLALWGLCFSDQVKRFVSSVVGRQGDDAGSIVDHFLDNRLNLMLYVLATPSALSTVWYFGRLRLFHRFAGFDHPTRTAWDWVFAQRRPIYILFHLKSRTKDGAQEIRVGYFNGKSFVSCYPFEEQVYVERVHVMTKDGRVGIAIPGSNGMLIRMAECERIEFLDDPSWRPVSLLSRCCHSVCSVFRLVLVPLVWCRVKAANLYRRVVSWQTNPMKVLEEEAVESSLPSTDGPERR